MFCNMLLMAGVETGHNTFFGIMYFKIMSMVRTLKWKQDTRRQRYKTIFQHDSAALACALKQCFNVYKV